MEQITGAGSLFPVCTSDVRAEGEEPCPADTAQTAPKSGAALPAPGAGPQGTGQPRCAHPECQRMGCLQRDPLAGPQDPLRGKVTCPVS